MLCSYDDLCSMICTVLRGRYCVIQHSWCSTNKTIIIVIIIEASEYSVFNSAVYDVKFNIILQIGITVLTVQTESS